MKKTTCGLMQMIFLLSVCSSSFGATYVAINCGGGEYTATNGTAYYADMGFSAGSSYSTGHSIADTEDDPLYQTKRYGDVTYSIPAPDGDYQVTLKMAETYRSAVDERLFDVSIEGTQVITNLDLVAVAGHDVAYDLTFATTVSDGALTVQMTGVTDNAIMNAILVSTDSTTIEPLEIVNMLFLGNSFTFRHNLPQLVKTVIEEGQSNLLVNASYMAYGGKSMFHHYKLYHSETKLREGTITAAEIEAVITDIQYLNTLSNPPAFYTEYYDTPGIAPVDWGVVQWMLPDAEGRQNYLLDSINAGQRTQWDYVVLQSWLDVVEDSEEGYGKYAEIFADIANEEGIKVILYVTASHAQNATPVSAPLNPVETMMQMQTVRELADRINPYAVVPVALGIEQLHTDGSDMTFRYVNDFHPNQYCAFLTANMFYAACFGESTEGFNWNTVTETKTYDGLDADGNDPTVVFDEPTKLLLQQTAYDAVMNFSDPQPPEPGAVAVAINCGGSAYTATDGTVYYADGGFSGGNTYGTSDPISGTEDDTLYQTERYNSGDLIYSIPVANGDYEVTLKMAEIYKTAVGQRLFDVSIEGTQVITNLDLVAVAGHDVAYDLTFATTVSDGALTIQITGVVDTAQMNAILVANTVTQSPYDEWADQFGGADVIGSATNDYDLDGISNLAEYALNGNPTHANGGELVTFNVSGTTVSFVYASNSVDDSLTYRLIDRTNLLAGAVRTNGWDSQRFGPVNGDYVTVSNQYGMATDARFIWLEVETP